jgi:hypothetical protein
VSSVDHDLPSRPVGALGALPPTLAVTGPSNSFRAKTLPPPPPAQRVFRQSSPLDDGPPRGRPPTKGPPQSRAINTGRLTFTASTLVMLLSAVGTTSGSCVIQPNHIGHVSITAATIPSDAFNQCASLKSVTLADSVTYIGQSAFYGTSLTFVVVPDSVTTISNRAFSNVTTLVGAQIGNSATFIGIYTFSLCNRLEWVSIPSSVTQDSVDWTALPNCIGIGLPLSTTQLRGNLTCLPCHGRSTVAIPDSVIAIGWFSWSQCLELRTVVIPNGVTAIGQGAFEYTYLTSLTLPDTLISIDLFAFQGNALSSIDLPDSLRSIGANVFMSTRTVTSIVIPDSVQTIGINAFRYCPRLTSVVIPNQARLASGAFADNGCQEASFSVGFAVSNCIVSTFAPTVSPTATPTAIPTLLPTAVPTAIPTVAPSAAPSRRPTTATPSASYVV